MLNLFRKAPEPVPAMPPAKPWLDVFCEVRDFFVFRDVLFVRGHLARVDGVDPRISVRMWDGTERPVDFAPDDFKPPTTEWCTFRFSLPLPIHTPIESILKMGVIFDYPSGRLVRDEFSAEAAKHDPFLKSESVFWDFVNAHPQANVLEIGSRARSGINRRGLFPATCGYTGFDIVEGENVDCVGDAHALSKFLPTDHYDAVFSVSVWEHLSMPWLVSLELNKVMKVGGLAMINTHQSWPSHEEPWDYFRFSNDSWDALFNAATGFEIVGRGAGIPCAMGPSQLHASVHASRIDWHYGYLATRCIARKVGSTRLEWPVDPGIVAKKAYPH